MADEPAPSEFFASHRVLVREAADAGPLLDLACGNGRHARAARAVGARVVALDRRAEPLRGLAGDPALLPVRCDLEAGHGIPLRAGAFAAVMVFRYLHRPLAPEIVRVLRPGGLLLYETFTVRQRELGFGPTNPDFLLREGELAQLFPALQTLEHEEGLLGEPRPAALARLLARKLP